MLESFVVDVALDLSADLAGEERSPARSTDMAAVLCSIFLPIMFGALFVVGSAMFVVLSGAVVFGAMRLVTSQEHE